MATLWDEIKKALKDGYITAAGKTEELTKIGRIKLDIVAVKRKIDKKFSELGGNVYHMLGESPDAGIAADANVQRIAAEIKDLESELKDKETKIETVKAEEKEKVQSRKQDGPA